VSEPAAATHRLLRRQLARLGLRDDGPPPTGAVWEALLARVSASYTEADQDRYTLERSLEISSREMQELYQDLVRSSQDQLTLERNKLQRSLATLHATLDASLDGVLVVDQDRCVVDFNHRFLELWSLTEEEVRGRHHQALMERAAPLVNDPEEFQRQVLQLYDNPTSAGHDELALRDGRVLERFSTPIHLPAGAAQGRVWFFRDVTMRRRTEEEMRQMSRFLDSIVENFPHLVVVKEATSLKLVRMNRAGEELLGWRRDEMLGKTAFDVFPPDQAAVLDADDRAVLDRGKPGSIEERVIVARDRGPITVHSKKIPILGADGRPEYLLGIMQDVSEAKQAERELREAKEAAERASRTKSGFLSNMSHEMRTPLNSILGFARVLHGERFGPLSERQREYVQYILRAGQHMLNLVNDLLDLRRLEEDRSALASTRLELAQLVDEAIQLVKALADEKKQTMAVELPAALPDALADRRAVVQILVNLLSNAVKFTPDGGRIAVRASVSPDQLHVAVTDSGIGIRPEDQARLFTYFEQVGAKSEHAMKGSGIGLALTRALVEKLGGAIQVSSAAGAGATFEFSIPRWTEPADHVV
jgi:PAS domain S-box-containing protein